MPNQQPQYPDLPEHQKPTDLPEHDLQSDTEKGDQQKDMNRKTNSSQDQEMYHRMDEQKNDPAEGQRELNS